MKKTEKIMKDPMRRKRLLKELQELTAYVEDEGVTIYNWETCYSSESKVIDVTKIKSVTGLGRTFLRVKLTVDMSHPEIKVKK